MDFILTGFGQDRGFRRYAFERVEPNRTRRRFSVEADIALLRKYQIGLQELPLLCRQLLEKDAGGETAEKLTFTEEHMREHVDQCAAVRRAAEQKRKINRRTPSNRVGQAWRNPTP